MLVIHLRSVLFDDSLSRQQIQTFLAAEAQMMDYKW